jgi:hypothetical protein
MTVSSSTSRVSYNGNGSTTVFAYTFKVLDQDDLTVIVRSSNGTETVQTITTHYTVSGVGSDSGGNVTMVTAPASGETITILREQPLTQGLDLVPNDPFPAETLEEALDKLTFMVQTIDEEVGRTIKASRTNTISTTEFAVSASDRANKVFAFDSSGDIAVTQEIGTFTGNWSTGTDYNQRDIIKDTSNNNIYIANTAHTSSGSQPISGNADSAKWDLLVDAASATTSATSAAASASAAATSETNAAASESNAAASESAAAASASNASTSETNAASSAADAAASAAAAATFDPDSVDINGGSIDGTPIGANSASTGAFTTLTVNGNAYPSAGALSNRNLIINGAMQVAQRGTSETGITGVGYYTADRVRVSFSGAIGAVVTQSVVSDQDVGDFIASAVKHDVTTTSGAGVVGFNYRAEVDDVKPHVGKEMTLSFYAKADAAVDIFPIIVGDTTITPSTITLGTTYQRYTITFTMPAVSGVSYLDVFLRADATVGTANYITGVQLEVGDTATPFEHRSYGQELARCQRYYQRTAKAVGSSFSYGASDVGYLKRANSNWLWGPLGGGFFVEMRTTPSFTHSDNSGTTGSVYMADGTTDTCVIQAYANGWARELKNGAFTDDAYFAWAADAEL